VEINVPSEMIKYVQTKNEQMEMERNALILYPYINNRVISHGKAAEILGIPKYDLIELYDRLGLAYLSFDLSEIEAEVDEWEKSQGKMHDSHR